MNPMPKFQLYTFSLFFLLVLFLLLFFVFHSLPSITEKAKLEAERLLTDEISRQLSNVVSQMKKIARNRRLDKFLIEEKVWRWFFEKKLEALITDHIRHLYVIYRREEGSFDYLIFVSQKGHPPDYTFLSRLEETIESAFRSKGDVVIKGEDFITLFKPVRVEGETVLLIGADFSPARFLEVERTINTMRNIIGVSASIISLLLTVLILLAVRSGFIERKLFVDPLTGVFNRNILPRIRNTVMTQHYGLLIVDVDNFKSINDTYGHEVGDKVLRAVSGRMRNLIKKDRDILVRYGGEEFLIFVKHNGEKERPLIVAERIRNAVRKNPIVVNGKSISVSVSVGVLPDVSEERDLEEAIRKADVALYTAKRKGKNRVEVFKEEAEAHHPLSFWDVREAIEEGRVEFLYQPVYDLESGKIVMLETLVRLKGASGDLITPERFLPVLRETEAHLILTKHAVIKNAEVLKKYPNIRLSLNVEMGVLSDGEVVDLIEESVKDSEGCLCLEIVENDGPSEEVTLRNLSRLKGSGVCIIVDDFGKGRSSLIKLAQLEVDYIKVAGEIVENLSRERFRVLCRGILEFCEEVGIGVVAKNISSEETLRAVRDLGIKLGQGVYLSEPKPLEHFLTRS